MTYQTPLYVTVIFVMSKRQHDQTSVVLCFMKHYSMKKQSWVSVNGFFSYFFFKHSSLQWLLGILFNRLLICSVPTGYLFSLLPSSCSTLSFCLLVWTRHLPQKVLWCPVEWAYRNPNGERKQLRTTVKDFELCS